MKTTLFSLLFLVGVYGILPGCKKSNSGPGNKGDSSTTTNKTDSSTYVSVSLLAAKWSIVSDTVTNVNNFSIDFYTPPSRHYIGGPNDYITFTTAGVVSGIEDSVAIAGTYTLSANSGITLSMLPSMAHGTVTTLTANALTITGRNTSANGSSWLTETISLKR
jgi:hypothetical protein